MDVSFLREKQEEWATLNMDAESSKPSVINHQLTQHIKQYSINSITIIVKHKRRLGLLTVAKTGKHDLDLDQAKRLSKLHVKTST
jgi:hypothetical protein